MDSSVRDLLAIRQRRATGRRVGSTIFSLLLHGGLAGTFLFAPALAARDDEPIQYTKVQIVPLKALGVPDPEPVRQAPPVRTPEPEPAPPQEEPAPPPKEETKRVPSPDAETRRTSRPQQSSSATGDPGTAADRPAQRRGTPDGNPLGLAPFGSNASGFDDPDFQYSYYTDMLLATIGGNYRRPAITAEVELIVHFRIARDGTVHDLKITQPSGYASFDQAGLSAVRSSKLPRLPVSYQHDSLGVSLIIR